ncbi:MAG: hypothetical protein V1723_02145 [Candidatus Uhrbacteria bacterium]
MGVSKEGGRNLSEIIDSVGALWQDCGGAFVQKSLYASDVTIWSRKACRSANWGYSSLWSLRGAKRRSNPDRSCSSHWIATLGSASLAMTSVWGGSQKGACAMGHGGRKSGNRKSGVRGRKDVERLSRGQSHDLLMHLEDVGLDPKLADELVQGPSRHLRAMIAAGAGVDQWSHRVCDWWRDVGFAIQDARREQWIREYESKGLSSEFWMTDAQRDEMMRRHAFIVPGYGGHGITTGAFVERVRDGWGLFYMPPKAELPEEWFAEQVEGGLIGLQAFEREWIRWELRERGYWFWLMLEHRIAPAGPNQPSPDHLAAIVRDAERHPDARDVRSTAEVFGSILGETCASIEEFLVASACGLATGWPLLLHDERLVLRSAYERGVLGMTRLLAIRIDAQRIGFGYWGDDELINPKAHGAGCAYRCAVERVATVPEA